MRLNVPGPYEARWLSEPEHGATAEQWIRSSQESWLYHTPPYLGFSREQNGWADLLWLTRDGNPVVGIPLHPAGDRRFSTAYAGLLLPPGRSDAVVRRGIAAFAELLEANRGLRLQVLQCPQARSYDSSGRMLAIARRLDEHRFTGPSMYSRMLDVPATERAEATPDVSPELLLDTGLKPYEPELRNQIRQAVRNGLTATCALPTTPSEIDDAYREFVPLHRESWQRTGMQPHDDRYWEALSAAIVGAGAKDLVVYVRNQNDQAVAAVISHVYDGRALYWAACSSEEGMRGRANPLCLHAAIQACGQLGVHRFELGRFQAREPSRKERSVTRYKGQFGGDLIRLVNLETQPPLRALAAALTAKVRPRNPDVD